jgi:hypothetical protein
MLKLLLAFLLLSILSCSSNEDEPILIYENPTSTTKFPIKPLELKKGNDGWGGDIKLSYLSLKGTGNMVIYEVRSTYENNQIGFEIWVPASGSGKLTIKRCGLDSDNFLQALAQIYKQRLNKNAMFVDMITADCMSMGDYVDSLKKQGAGHYVTAAQYKLFFQGESDDDYAEAYLEINETSHLIELIEKDEEYRKPIVKLFTRK